MACPLSIAKTWISEWFNQNQLYFLNHSHLRGIDASPMLALQETSDSFPLAWDRLHIDCYRMAGTDSFPLAWDRH